jgi:hypothetical protein
MGNLGGYSCICENIAYMETGIWFSYGQWIGLGENLQESLIFDLMAKSMVSCRFSLKPIH